MSVLLESVSVSAQTGVYTIGWFGIAALLDSFQEKGIVPVMGMYPGKLASKPGKSWDHFDFPQVRNELNGSQTWSSDLHRNSKLLLSRELIPSTARSAGIIGNRDISRLRYSLHPTVFGFSKRIEPTPASAWKIYGESRARSWKNGKMELSG
ncbi:MAG: hypothetical protein U0V70_13340 [Terriglobia bacterium]